MHPNQVQQMAEQQSEQPQDYASATVVLSDGREVQFGRCRHGLNPTPVGLLLVLRAMEDDDFGHEKGDTWSTLLVPGIQIKMRPAKLQGLLS